MTDTLILQPASRPESRRGTGAVGVNWAEKLGPTLQANVGENFLLFAFSAEDKGKAISRAATISNYLWKNDTGHEYSVVARLNEAQDSYEVHARYIGPMSAERRKELTEARIARTPKSRRQSDQSAPVTPITDAKPSTPAERAKAAANK